MQGFEYWQKRGKKDLKRDWSYKTTNWLNGYWESIKHEHRAALIKELRKLPLFTSVLELGCNVGPNLALIRNKFPDVELFYGIDANEAAIESAKEVLHDMLFHVGDIAKSLPYEDKSVDLVIADAVLMYISPNEIGDVMQEINRIARTSIAIVDWYDESILGVEKDFHWARNYPEILKDLGFIVNTRKFSKHEWPTEKWYTNGHIFTGRR